MFIIYIFWISVFAAGSLAIAAIRGSYIGCYRQEALGGGSIANWAKSSVQVCLNYCYDNRDYTYAGVQQGGSYCFGVDQLPAERNPGACNSTCRVSGSDPRCGGHKYVGIFTICPLGFYGKVCNKACPCEHGGVCHRIKGDCMCHGGYLGSTCAHQSCRVDNGGCEGRCNGNADRSWCSCDTNFYLQADNRTCQDVDECQTNNGGCAQDCHNTVGSYECRCGEGYQLDQDKRSCVDIDECSIDTPAGCEHRCNNTAGSYTCSCRPGFSLHSDFKKCENTTMIPMELTSDLVPYIAGGTVGGLVVLALVIVVIVLATRMIKRKASRRQDKGETDQLPSGIVVAGQPLSDPIEESPTSANTVVTGSEQDKEMDINQSSTSPAQSTVSKDTPTTSNATPSTSAVPNINPYIPTATSDEAAADFDPPTSSEAPVPFEETPSDNVDGKENSGETSKKNVSFLSTLGKILPINPKKQQRTGKKTKETEVKGDPSTRIPVTDLQQYIEDGKKDNNRKFEVEFKSIVSKDSPFTVANSVPKELNKFRNTIPYDHNRVVLESTDVEFSHYINASYMTIPESTDKYIACQGPQEATVNDFWRMIWETDTNIIVMLTNPVENGKRKCDEYWVREQVGMLKLSVAKVENYGEFLKRVITVTKDGDEKAVSQYHFHSWPDHRVPDNATGLLQMRAKMQKDIKKDKCIAVHCSAGVGRTGTFMSMDHLLRQADTHGYVDVPAFVATLRDNRPQMVQTLIQYVFIYEALLEGSVVGNTAIPSDQFTHIVDTDDRKTVRVKQYKFLQSTAKVFSDEELSDALLPENTEKNRTNEFVPSNARRVRLLNPLPGNTDYINAAFIDAYEGERSSIATQVPLADTVSDFWAMVHGYKCSTVIILEDRAQLDELCSTVLPEEGKSTALVCGEYQLSVTGSDALDRVQILSVNLTKGQVSDTGEVYENLKPKVNEETLKLDVLTLKGDFDSGFITSAFDLVQSRRKDKTPTVVMCRDSVSRCGVYLAATNMFSKINLEHDVDVFYSVRRLRNSSPYFITSQEQYLLLDEIANDYLKTFNTYANFR